MGYEGILVLYQYYRNFFKKRKNSEFLKKLLLIWLTYLANVTYKLDDHVATAIKYINMEDPNKYKEAQPLCNEY